MPPQKVAEPGQYGGKASPKPTVHSFNNVRTEQLQKATVRTYCFCDSQYYNAGLYNLAESKINPYFWAKIRQALGWWNR